MREIKFKAKRLDNREWCEGYFYEENGNTYIIENRQKESMLNRNVTHQVDPSTICQFTGQKDCEGNEIWENDLLKNNDSDKIDSVVFKYGAFCSLADDGKSYCIALTYLSEDNIVYNERVVGNKFDKEK